MPTINHRNMPFEIKALEKDGSFAGYGSVFGNTDLYQDVVMPGAFEKSLAGWQGKKRFPPVLWQHNAAQPLGPFTKMVEDGKGLYVEGRLLKDEVQLAREAYALMASNAIDGLSIGYQSIDAQFDREAGVNQIKEAKLWEVSIVTFPANVEATITEVRSMATLSADELERSLRQMYPGTPRRLLTRMARLCVDEAKNRDPNRDERPVFDSARLSAFCAAVAALKNQR